MPFDNRPTPPSGFGAPPQLKTRTGQLGRKHKLKELLKIINDDPAKNEANKKKAPVIPPGYHRCSKGCGKIYRNYIVELHESQVREKQCVEGS